MDYIDRERFFHEDRTSEPDKMWLIIFDKKEVYYSSTDYDNTLKVYKRISNESNQKYEFGYIYEDDFEFEFYAVYNLFNPIKIIL